MLLVQRTQLDAAVTANELVALLAECTAQLRCQHRPSASRCCRRCGGWRRHVPRVDAHSSDGGSGFLPLGPTSADGFEAAAAGYGSAELLHIDHLGGLGFGAIEGVLDAAFSLAVAIGALPRVDRALLALLPSLEPFAACTSLFTCPSLERVRLRHSFDEGGQQLPLHPLCEVFRGCARCRARHGLVCLPIGTQPRSTQ